MNEKGELMPPGTGNRIPAVSSRVALLPLFRQWWKRFFKDNSPTLAAILAGLAAFCFILVIPLPAAISLNLYFMSSIGALVLFMVLVLIYFRPGGLILPALVILVLFAQALTFKWQTAYSDGSLVAGLIPMNDAQGYYYEVQRLLSGFKLEDPGSRRVLFSSILSVILYFTGVNLAVTLEVLAAIAAVAVFFAAVEMRALFGPWGAAFFTELSYLYYKRFIGILLSEQAGFAFGALALAFLLRSVRERNLRAASPGIFLLWTALSARPGAFFVVPFLFVWMFTVFRKRRKAVAAGMTAVMAAAACNLALFYCFAAHGHIPFSNYAFSLYGLASGNLNWTQILKDHPGIYRGQEIYSLAFQKIAADPATFLKGVSRSFFGYFSLSEGAFSFLQFRDGFPQRMVWYLSIWSLMIALSRLRQNENIFLLAAVSGIVLSSVAVPTPDCDGMRVYAATMPLLICFVSAGLRGKLRHHLRHQRTALISGQVPLTAFSAALLIVSLILPFIAFGSRTDPPARVAFCPPGTIWSPLSLAGSAAKIVSDRDIDESYLPLVRLSDFRAGIETATLMKKELENMQEGETIALTRTKVALFRTDPPPPGMQVCAHRSGDYYMVDEPSFRPSEPFIDRHPKLALYLRWIMVISFLFLVLKEAAIIAVDHAVK